MRSYNGYTFDSRKALREALKYYIDLNACAGQGDMISASIVVDLDNALTMIAPRQRQAIDLHLLKNIPAPMVANEMGIVVRAVYWNVDEGLLSMLRYFETGKVALWPAEQVEFIRYNCGSMTDEELGSHIGRTAKAVANMLWRLRVNGEDLPRRRLKNIA